MNKEEMKLMIKDCVYSEDGITYMSDKQYNNYINIIEQLQQKNQSLKKENKILRENAEHNDKVVDKINWENQKLKKQQKDFIDYLENEKNIYSYDISDYTYEDIINTILSKYYEIIDELEKGE